MCIVIGIDPGLTGAIAFLSHNRPPDVVDLISRFSRTQEEADRDEGDLSIGEQLAHLFDRERAVANAVRNAR